MVVLHRRAIAHSADLINTDVLAVEMERAITSQAADTATRTIGEIMRWIDWYAVNKGDITEEECKKNVAAVIEELHKLLVGVRPMLRRLGSRHPLISKVADLKILLVYNALTVNLEEKEICVPLLEEFFLTERGGGEKGKETALEELEEQEAGAGSRGQLCGQEVVCWDRY